MLKLFCIVALIIFYLIAAGLFIRIIKFAETGKQEYKHNPLVFWKYYKQRGKHSKSKKDAK